MKIDPIPHVKIDPIPQRSQRKVSKRNRGNIVKVGVFLLVLLTLLGWDRISDTYTVLSYNGDPRVIALSNDAGMNVKGKALFFSNSPEIVSANTLHKHCPMEYEESVEYGCYLPSKEKIYILDIADEPFSSASVSTAAHELLHVAWYEVSSAERATLSDALNRHLDTKKDSRTASILERLDLYDSAEDIQMGEAHSFIGSELSEAHTDDILDDHYGRYFADRSKSADAQKRFEDGVAAKEKEFKTRKQALDKELSEIEEFERRWLTPFDAALQTSAYYGDYYTYNKNVDAYNGNLEIYNDMVDAYEKLRKQYNADVDDYNAVMDALLPDERVEPV